MLNWTKKDREGGAIGRFDAGGIPTWGVENADGLLGKYQERKRGKTNT